MLEAYSLSVDVAANDAVPFQNVTIQKGCSAVLSGTNSVDLNKAGVYMVAVSASASVSTTLQLYKDGVAQPQAQNTGLNPCFVTLVQVQENNCCCPCTSATRIQILNDTTATLDIDVVVTKVV